MTSTLLRGLGAVAVLLFLIAAFTPAVGLVGARFDPDRPPERAEAIVVLGAGGVAPGGGLTDTSLRAAMEGVGLFRKGWAPLLVFSGGADRPGGPTEADVRAEFARQGGVPAAAILTLSTARTTHEEALQMRALLEPRGIHKILLVVDGPGLTRAMGVFERAGFDAVPAPWSPAGNPGAGPEDRLGLLRQLAMELIARAYYRAMGYL